MTDVSGDRATRLADGPIHALLVDGDQHRARQVAGDLERHAPDLSVTVATNANEAMLDLTDDGRVDCVVASHRLTDIDGLHLLERVREEWGDLPFVLVAGRDNGDVVARATDSGVTDYLETESATEQPAVLATRIRTAVEQRRLRAALATSEERYRTVVEQSRDAIAVVRDGRIVDANPALAELGGGDRDSLLGADFVECVVHPEDRADVRGLVERAGRPEDRVAEGSGSEGPRDSDRAGRTSELRVLTGGGAVRYCELAAHAIPHDGESAVSVSLRDVTERRQRDQAVARERSLTQATKTALVEADTRAEFERTIVEELCDHDYALAWIGSVDGDGLSPRAVAGEDTSYVDAALFAGTDSESAPSVWAVRSGEPRFVQDFGALFEAPWRDAAVERGLHSGAALPLVHDDVGYGVLGVYRSGVGEFGETEQQLLAHLADTVAFAVHVIETDTALASDRVAAATLQVGDGSHYLCAVARRTAERATADRRAVELTVHGTVPQGGEEVAQYVSVPERHAERAEAALADNDAVGAVSRVADGPETRFMVVTDAATPEADLASQGAVVRETSVAAGHAEVAVEVAARRDLRSMVDALEAAHGPTSVLSYVESDGGYDDGVDRRAVDTGVLTDKQAAALEAAYHHGYFERPRENSASEVAASLGVTHATYLQHLRAAQRKLLGQLYASSDAH